MKKLFIETYGCQMNVADSEVVASVMQMAGYEICEKEEDADAIFSTHAVSERMRKTRFIIASTPSMLSRKGQKGNPRCVGLYG